MTTLEIMQAAKAAAPRLCGLRAEEKNALLHTIADSVLAAGREILAENARFAVCRQAPTWT